MNEWMINWLIDWLIDWSIDWLIDWFTDGLSHQLIDWFRLSKLGGHKISTTRASYRSSCTGEFFRCSFHIVSRVQGVRVASVHTVIAAKRKMHNRLVTKYNIHSGQSYCYNITQSPRLASPRWRYCWSREGQGWTRNMGQDETLAVQTPR